MVGFVRKKVKSYTLGEKLRRLREDSRISLAEISKATKIRKVYLEKLEEGKFEELPADVYIKGFLKNYAQYLGIEPQEVIRQYEKERGVQNSIKKYKLPPNKLERFRLPAITITPRMFTVTAFVLLVLGGFFYFYREIGKFSEMPRLVMVQPMSDLSIDGSTVDVIGITDKDCKITINDQPVFVNEKGEFNETLSLQQGINTIEVKSLNRFGKEAKKLYNISAHYENQLSDREREERVAGAETESKPEKVQLEIKVEDQPTWVSVEVDGQNVQSGTMLPGASQTFEGENQIAVTSGKANKTFIKLNGQDIGALGTTPGIIREVIFTKDTKFMPQPEVKEEEPKEEEKPAENEDKTKKKKKN